jgi:hypothetical protein
LGGFQRYRVPTPLRATLETLANVTLEDGETIDGGVVDVDHVLEIRDRFFA